MIAFYAVAASGLATASESKAPPGLRIPPAPALLAKVAPAPILYADADSGKGAPVDVYGFKRKSPGRAFLQSFLLPGWGQVYNQSAIWKPVAFVGLEAAGWFGVSHFHSQGKTKEREYKTYADQHWDSASYFNGLYHVYYLSHYRLPYPDYDNRWMDTLKWIDAALGDHTWSHHAYFKDKTTPVPPDEHYENIGKYNQFAFGWDDFPKPGDDAFPDSTGDIARINYQSPHRLHYLDMRDKSNKQYKLASTILVLTIGNHLLSAFEAAIGARRYNRGQDQFGTIEPHMQLSRAPSGGGLMTTVMVAYRF